ncbi:MAG: hypothetical protein ACODAJ_13235 [Planctomycetota bacterium]
MVEEEADESAYWLELTMDGQVMERSRVTALHEEAEAILKIISASHKTASRNARR